MNLKNEGKNPIQASGFMNEEIEAYKKVIAIPNLRKKEIKFCFFIYATIIVPLTLDFKWS